MLEENTDKIIDELGIGFNKLNNKLTNLLEENQHLKQLIVNLEKEKNEEIKLLNKKYDDLKNSLIEKDNQIAKYKVEIQNVQEYSRSTFNKKPEKSKIRVVVGLDFGTKYSLFSYCHVSGNQCIRTNDIWHEKVGQLRTNTVLQYDETYKNVKLWGTPALAKTRNIKNDKFVELFILHLSDLPDNLKPILPIKYKKAITDYLREIGKVIQKTVKTNWPNINFFENVLLVLTVPAVYPENSKEIMRECAYKAGLLVDKFSANLQFTTESEAAAAHCIENIPKAQTLKSGNIFMMVNCDDDTIDLSLQKLNDKRLSEIIIRTSGIRKSALIEAEFIKYLRKKLGDDTMDLLRDNNYGQMQFMIQQFCNSVKIHFKGDSSFSYELDIQDTIPILTKYVINKSIRKKLEKNEWIIRIDYKGMILMLEPIIQKVFNLINDQLYKSQVICTAMFLVGSLSESIYLQNRVREEFQNQVKIISVPIQPTAAMARGAVTYGLSMVT
ncbi:9076_t:CDS:2 [Rhizophagus irregularis]|nr:9076_t:CDS:2 [Rhizophagus irregularis]